MKRKQRGAATEISVHGEKSFPADLVQTLPVVPVCSGCNRWVRKVRFLSWCPGLVRMSRPAACTARSCPTLQLLASSIVSFSAGLFVCSRELDLHRCLLAHPAPWGRASAVSLGLVHTLPRLGEPGRKR